MKPIVTLTRWLAFLAVFLAVSVAYADKPMSMDPDQNVLDSFQALKMYIKEIPQASLNKGRKRSFLAKLNSAENAYLRGQICTSENIMQAYLHEAQKLRHGNQVFVAESLYSKGRSLIDSFFDVFYNNPDMAAPKCFDPDARSAPKMTVHGSDNTQFAASVAFGTPQFANIEAAGESWSQISLPGIEPQGGVPGMPALPFWRGLLAVPMGATAKLQMMQTPMAAETILVNLYPFQSEAADQQLPSPDPEFLNQPFFKNEKLYLQNAFYPESPCSVTPLGAFRDLQMVQVVCASGQYNPVTDELRLFKAVDFEVDFEGGEGHFLTTQSVSPFEPMAEYINSTVINNSIVAEYIKDLDISNRICTGEELLILTHPDFRDAADDLAQWKEDKGIVTSVREVGAGTIYNTGSEIDDLIEHRYDNCVVRPSYVLLLGDAEFVPPARTDYDTTGDYCGSCGDATTGSDWGYALYPQWLFDVFFPDFGVARIAVDTLGEAQRVVDKIINYESNPPLIDFGAGAPFYTTAALAAQFQCCRMNQNGSPLDGQDGRAQRSFVETAESARSAIMAAGKAGERIYMQTLDNGGYCLVQPGPSGCPLDKIQQSYTGNSIPNRYYNGNLLPMDLRSGSGFAWSGDTSDVANAFNEGRFLILHRDHGSSSGFGHPSFKTSDLWRLSNNDLLPVVYSVNCASGFFDRETDSGSSSESFMEQLLLESDGGMVGGLGDNRNSPSWANSALTRGFFDATWPNLAPEYGSGTSIRRLADILNHGKVYMMTQVGVPQTAGSVSLEAAIAQYIMWHAFGDPTLEMWTRNPYGLVLSVDFQLERFIDRLEVIYPVDGAVITAFQKIGDGMIPIGRGMVQDGVAEMEYFMEPDSRYQIMLSASKENAVSVLLTKEEGHPDLVIQDLILSSSTLEIGDDLSTMLDIKVGNIGGATAEGTIDAAGNPKPGYMIDLVLSADTSMPVGFASVPLPEGEAYEEDGLLKGGRVSRTPDIPAMTDIELSMSSVGSDIGGIIPLQAPTGNLYLCARIDPGDTVAESDESNNVFCAPVTISIPPPQ